MKAEEFYEQQRKRGLTDDITSAPDPDYSLPFYAEIIRLMEAYAKAYHLEQSKDLIPLSEALEFAEEVPDNGWVQVSQGIWRNVMEANVPEDVRKTTAELYQEFKKAKEQQ